MFAQEKDSLSCMKKHLILPSSLLILLLFLIGGVVFLPAGAATIIGSAKFDPDRVDLALPAPSIVKATIRFPSGSPYKVSDIDPSTILLEGSLSPSTTYLIPGGLVAVFDGDTVVNIIWARIYHVGMPPPPHKISLTITGNLYSSAGGTPFSATGSIRIVVPRTPEPT